MKIKTFIFNPLQENTYLVINEDYNQCMVIDAGCLFDAEKKELASYIRSNGLQLTYVVNTHLHLDHCFGNGFLYETFGVKPMAHPDDEYYLRFMKAHAGVFGVPFNEEPQPLGCYLNEGDTLLLGNEKFEIIHVPGHSEGGIMLYNAAHGILFSGDSLFQMSIGRTDLPGGNYATLINSLTKKVMTLPDETVVYPGHGPTTTIEQEKMYNAYL
jgi:glyoxylase-like metal-dependent hydrolase (beta-lactamase superfamily II)